MPGCATLVPPPPSPSSRLARLTVRYPAHDVQVPPRAMSKHRSSPSGYHGVEWVRWGWRAGAGATHGERGTVRAGVIVVDGSDHRDGYDRPDRGTAGDRTRPVGRQCGR